MTQVEFSPQSWRSGGQTMMQAGDQLATGANSFLSEVGDSSVFGGNDVLGSVASMIYGLMVERMGGCLDALAAGYQSYGDLAVQTGDAYEETEAQATALAESIEEEI